ncbi:MAG: glutamate--tRNA ligase [Phycisphaerae bacterium]|nr:glutamate--tRNA ligase [Phycisphaerae bacterium]
MPDHQPALITRFAPSPTGHLHIGGARTALFCWALAHNAKRNDADGRFLLRIEDTDQARSSEDAAKGILEDLAWLGITWDEGPHWVGRLSEPSASFSSDVGSESRPTQTLGGDPRNVGPFNQSQRMDLYAEHLQRLIDADLAYPAFDTPDELAAMRKAAEAEKRSFIYRRADDYNRDAALERAMTEPHVIRFRMPPEPVTVSDDVLGEVTFPYEELDDLVIRKADGFPTYHFAVVVDDALMGVTHVLRGQEHLNNSPRHVALQRALGFESPRFAHMPLIFNIDGTKMSKRDKDKAAKKAIRDAKLDNSPVEAIDNDTFATWLKDKARQLPREQLGAIATAIDLQLPEIDVEDFRAAGYLPGVICNFIALLGWNPGLKDAEGHDVERFDMDFLAEKFSVDRIGKSNAKFDRDKLLAFNAHTLQHDLTDEAFAAEWLAWAQRFDNELATWANADQTRWTRAAAAARPRAKTLRDAHEAIAFALIADDAFDYDDKAVNKFLLKGEPAGKDVLPDLRAALDAIDDWSPDPIDAAIANRAESRDLGMGKVAQPLRIALTGAAVSPPLGLSLSLLAKQSVLARIDRCAEATARPSNEATKA